MKVSLGLWPAEISWSRMRESTGGPISWVMTEREGQRDASSRYFSLQDRHWADKEPFTKLVNRGQSKGSVSAIIELLEGTAKLSGIACYCSFPAQREHVHTNCL